MNDERLIFDIDSLVEIASKSDQKIVYANGCSMTFGQEIAGFNDLFISNSLPHLETVGEEYHKQRLLNCFAGHISQAVKGGSIFYNDALMGGSNDRIVRTTLYAITKLLTSGIDPKRLRVVIGFTSAARKEVCENFQARNRYVDVHLNVKNPLNLASKKFKDVWEDCFLSYIEMVDRFLVQILSLHSFFKLHGIEHIFVDAISPIPANGWFIEKEFDSVGQDYTHKLAQLNLSESVSPTNYYSSVFQLFDGDNKYSNWYISDFHGFCVKNKYPLGPNHHPLALGHFMWAQEIIKFLKTSNPNFLE